MAEDLKESASKSRGKTAAKLGRPSLPGRAKNAPDLLQRSDERKSLVVPKNPKKKNDVALSELARPQKKPKYDFDAEASFVELPKYKRQ